MHVARRFNSIFVKSYQEWLARSCGNAVFKFENISVDQRDTVLAWHQKSLEIWSQLVGRHAEVPSHASHLGATLSNLAIVDVSRGLFLDARDKLTEAVKQQQIALASNPDHPLYKLFVRNHLIQLVKVAEKLEDEELRASTKEQLKAISKHM